MASLKIKNNILPKNTRSQNLGNIDHFWKEIAICDTIFSYVTDGPICSFIIKNENKSYDLIWDSATNEFKKQIDGVVSDIIIRGTINTPTISYSNNIKINDSNTINISAISTEGITDTGKYTHIQIASDINFSSIIQEYNNTYITSFTTNAINALGTYYIRARHCGTKLGWSDFSNVGTFTVVNSIGTLTFTYSTTYTVPYSGTYTIFVCGGAGYNGQNGNVGRNGGDAGGNSQVLTISGTAIDIFASGGAGGGGASHYVYPTGQTGGTDGANSTWYTGGKGATRSGDLATAGGGGTGSSPYGISPAVPSAPQGYQQGGRGGFGGTASASVFLDANTVLQIIIGSGSGNGVVRISN